MSAASQFPRSLRTNVSNPDFLTKYEVQTYKIPGPTIFMIKPGNYIFCDRQISAQSQHFIYCASFRCLFTNRSILSRARFRSFKEYA